MKNCFLLSLFLFSFFAVCQRQNQTDSLLTNAEKWKAQDSLRNWLVCQKKISQAYRDEALISEAKQQINEALKEVWRKPKTNSEREQLAWLYTNRAYLFEQYEGNFLNAKHDYEKAFRLFEEIATSNFYVARFIWHPLGNIYTRLGENEQATHFIKKALELYEKNNIENSIVDAYNDLGLIYINTQKYKSSIKAFDKGIAINIRSKNGLLYSNKAKAYTALGEYQKGISAIQKAIDLLQNEPPDHLIKTSLLVAYEMYGILLSKAGKPKAASAQFKKALAYQEIFSSQKHRKIASIYLGMGANDLLQDDYYQALTNYQKAIVHAIPGFNDTSLHVNPNSTLLYAEITIGEALLGKAKAATLFYNKTHDQDWLFIAKNCYQLYFDWEKLLRKEFRYEVSKLDFTAELHQNASSAIALLFKMQQLHIEGQWAELAFQWIEQTKGVLLSESTAQASNAFPELKNDSVFVQLKWAQKQLVELKSNSLITDSISHSLLKQQLEVKVQLLETSLYEKFPSLVKFKQRSNLSVSNKALLIYLKEQKADLISYFLGDSLGFVTLVNNGNFYLKKINRHDCKLAFYSLKKQLYRINRVTADQYEKAAYNLYTNLVGPFDTILSANQWIIIPDAEIGELPFDALVTEVNGKNSFKKLDYLLLHKTINYAPSAKFLLLPPKKNRAQHDYLGIAPQFKHSPFPELKYAKKEVSVGKSIYSGTLLVDSKANKTEILEQISTHNIIHWVSHAQKRKGSKEQAWIGFSSHKKDNYKLYASQLLGLQLSNQLLLLNACETGGGKYYPGEGTYSLAREFLFIGSENVITNLWQANHEVNLNIFTSFYDYLANNKSISYALQQAKRDYLKNQDTDELGAHPYYWASLALMGNNKALESKPTISYTVLIGLMLVVFIVLMIFVKLR